MPPPRVSSMTTRLTCENWWWRYGRENTQSLPRRSFAVLVIASSYLFKRKCESAVVFVTVTEDTVGDRAGALGALASQIEMANERIRARTIAEAERNVAYLNEHLTNTSVVAVQNSISTLLENQIKKIMLAQGTDQYAFRVIDPALPPERSSFPKRIVWGILVSFIGLTVSIAFAIFRRAGRYLGQHPAE